MVAKQKVFKRTKTKRYAPLGDYLRQLDAAQTTVSLRFAQIEKIIGHALPESAIRHHHQWWANQASGSRAPHWHDAGFRVARVDIGNRRVRFERIEANRNITLRSPGLQEVISAVNEMAASRLLGTLQAWRKTNKTLAQVPCRTVFYAKAEPNRSWVFHAGGLSELQFNLAFEGDGADAYLRHGVAFSLRPTREMPTIDPLLPKVERFNEYLRIYPDDFTDLRMWHFDNNERSTDYPVTPIPEDLARANMFIFVGAKQGKKEVNIGRILDVLDNLMPLYKFVEGREGFPRRITTQVGFSWSPGNRERATSSSYERSCKSIDKELRHNLIQSALFDYLVTIHGRANVSGEQCTGNGTAIDIAVRHRARYTYYEIKTGLSAQSCIRQALGQLLEYAYWPGNQRAEKLVVVGEARCDDQATSYIKCLRKQFHLPIEYKRFDMTAGRLR